MKNCKTIITSCLVLLQTSAVSLAQTPENYLVKFDLNYPSSVNNIEPLSVKSGYVLPLENKPLPERDGYLFAGWYTAADCNTDQEWLFGKMLTSYFPQEYADSMAVTKSMTLYARWESPTHVKTAKEFDNIRKNLHGWYVLDKDIDLSAFGCWQPIGGYTPKYDYAECEWWRMSFKGILDGQGHTIRGLKLTDGASPFNGIFASIANGEVRNLIVDSPYMNITAESVYSAPIVSLIKENDVNKAALTNVTVKNADINVVINSSESIYSAVTSLAGGVWIGVIENCHLSGKINVSIGGKGKGQLYVGGLMGEGYSNTRFCTSKLKVKVDMSKFEGELTTQVGDLQSSGTNISSSASYGDINVIGGNGVKALYVGGIVGSERYGLIKNCASQTDISVRNSSVVNVGGILGEFESTTFGATGTMHGISVTEVVNSYSSGTISVIGVTKLNIGGISGVGLPKPLKGWTGKTMSYGLRNCAYISNSDKVLLDGDVESLHGFSDINAMRDALKNILQTNDNYNQWNFKVGSLPVPEGIEE